MQGGNAYCTHEFYKSERHTVKGEETKIYLGLTNLRFIKEVMTYKIESVRIPKERIEMYARHQFLGPDDIALVKTKERVVFKPGKIMPVYFPCEKLTP